MKRLVGLANSVQGGIKHPLNVSAGQAGILHSVQMPICAGSVSDVPEELLISCPHILPSCLFPPALCLRWSYVSVFVTMLYVR
jgi:hypothetical protein